MKKTWLITGCSSGLGRNLAQAALIVHDNPLLSAGLEAAFRGDDEFIWSRHEHHGIHGVAELFERKFALHWQGRRASIPRHQTVCSIPPALGRPLTIEDVAQEPIRQAAIPSASSPIKLERHS